MASGNARSSRCRLPESRGRRRRGSCESSSDRREGWDPGPPPAPHSDQSVSSRVALMKGLVLHTRRYLSSCSCERNEGKRNDFEHSCNSGLVTHRWRPSIGRVMGTCVACRPRKPSRGGPLRRVVTCVAGCAGSSRCCWGCSCCRAPSVRPLPPTRSLSTTPCFWLSGKSQGRLVVESCKGRAGTSKNKH